MNPMIAVAALALGALWGAGLRVKFQGISEGRAALQVVAWGTFVGATIAGFVHLAYGLAA